MANFFKIINITGSLPKRHPKRNITLEIKYGNGFKSETKLLSAGGEMFITCEKLPMNIQKLNLDKLVVINRVTENDMKRIQRKSLIPEINVAKKHENDIQPEVVVTLIEEKLEEKPKKSLRRKSDSEE